ncbi:uncharacterized protein BO97DRAFT_278605 [Aspergillus homomorphus CBS 101889]|uniref:Uncharacterized protein n=1 Tax=Aspergillus homomorphus (strain CBS 101889) TaxID=1450537 RepID=A0A395HG21_ASPHC|nr:hypothetical protein BO97DRAFT_278605 [Aspergillus homomorphus CBS 101889]RAL06852.1 hypothetical protein BO97DRAFT_278605 [Aspergillus homomorphus CBS 101889]
MQSLIDKRGLRDARQSRQSTNIINQLPHPSSKPLQRIRGLHDANPQKDNTADPVAAGSSSAIHSFIHSFIHLSVQSFLPFHVYYNNDPYHPPIHHLSNTRPDHTAAAAAAAAAAKPPVTVHQLTQPQYPGMQLEV